jgi:hypothetical protein
MKLLAVGLRRTYPTDTFAANNRCNNYKDKLKFLAVGLRRTYPTDTFAANNRSKKTQVQINNIYDNIDGGVSADKEKRGGNYK